MYEQYSSILRPRPNALTNERNWKETEGKKQQLKELAQQNTLSK